MQNFETHFMNKKTLTPINGTAELKGEHRNQLDLQNIYNLKAYCFTTSKKGAKKISYPLEYPGSPS